MCRWAEFRQEVLKHPRGKEVLVSGRPDNHDIPWISQQIQDLLQACACTGFRLQTASP